MNKEGRIIDHGQFTERLLHGLSEGAKGPNGSVTTALLHDYLEGFRHHQPEGGRMARLIHRGGKHFTLIRDMAPPPKPQPVRTGDPARPEPKPNLKLNTTVPDHLDIASTVDQLNRKPFARILARRIWEINERRQRATTPKHEREGAYIVHLHGRWGEGKSTVLNFLKEELRPNDERTGWVVVEFNAWRTQSARPPWWTLVRAISEGALSQAPRKRWFGIKLAWHWWQRWAALIPVLTAVAMLAIVGIVVKNVDKGTDLVVAVVGGVITLAALGRNLFFGSTKAAESFMDQRKDSMGTVKRQYRKLISAIEQPVIVFVDDVDRCDKTYVVELLEGIQTLFRDAPVTFLIAADRKWICRSFEKHFEDFNDSVGEPTRPLGYLFLEKLFQLSVSLPPLSAAMQKEFAQALLRKGLDPKKAEEELEKAEKDAELKLDSMAPNTDTDALIDGTKDMVEKQAIQRVVAKRLASVENDLARSHELEEGYPELMERNPRAMKRLLNAYGMQQALNKLRNERMPTDQLIRWTIVELRWPRFAEYACEEPDVMDIVGTPLSSFAAFGPLIADVFNALHSGAPPYVKQLLSDPQMKSVVFAKDGTTRTLTAQVLRQLMGTVGPPQPGGGPGRLDIPPKGTTTSA